MTEPKDGVGASRTTDLREVLTVLERLLPQHKTDSMRGQIEAAIAALRASGMAVPDGGQQQ